MLACLNDLNFNYTVFDAVDGRLEKCLSSSQSASSHVGCGGSCPGC